MLVVSADAWNRSRIDTVTCVAVTTNLRLADVPGNVLLPEGAGGLEEESVANVSQVVTLDKEWLTERIGVLDSMRCRAGSTLACAALRPLVTRTGAIVLR